MNDDFKEFLVQSMPIKINSVLLGFEFDISHPQLDGIMTIFFIFFKFLFGVLCHFQHCTGHVTTGSWKGRRNQYIQFVRVLYCKLPTNGKQLPAFPLEAVPGIEPQFQFQFNFYSA